MCKLSLGGVYVCQHLSFIGDRKTVGGKAKVRTGLGKSDRPGSQGGLRKHGLWWKWFMAEKRKRRKVMLSPKVWCAVFLSRR